MRHGRSRLLAACLFSSASLAIVLLSGCGSAFSSGWRQSAITIDGGSSDWSSAITPLSDDEQVQAGFANDDKNLYLIFVVSDRHRQAQIFAGGCTIWFDPSGKEKKSFGVRYPAGIPEEKRSTFVRALLDGEDMDSLLSASSAIGAEIEIIGDEHAPGQKMRIGEAGSRAAIKPAGRALIYELEVPLAPSNETPYAIDASPGEKISVGLEPREALPPHGGRGGPESGWGGRPEGGPHGGGRHEGGPETGAGPRRWPGGGHGGPGGGPEDSTIWMKVALSGPK